MDDKELELISSHKLCQSICNKSLDMGYILNRTMEEVLPPIRKLPIKKQIEYQNILTDIVETSQTEDEIIQRAKEAYNNL